MRFSLFRALSFCISLTALASGCADESTSQETLLHPVPSQIQEIKETPAVNSISEEIPITPISTDVRQPKGSGTISYEKAITHLSQEQAKILLDYMDLYYESLSCLEAGEPASLFAKEAMDQALSNKSAWKIIIDVRKMQGPKLSLSAYSYTLHCTDVLTEDNGDISVSAQEKSVQTFTAFPGVKSESHNVRHRFTLTQTSGGWRLRSHTQMDSASMMALGRSIYRGWRGGSESETEIDLAEQLATQRESVLKAHADNLSVRNRQRASYIPDADIPYKWTNDYNREASVAYAMKWVGARNTKNWPTYDRNGGNCANFVSQCLLAGGIPMDSTGSSQWKWYGSTPNTSQTASGRSGSWSSVGEFYSYANKNSGFGMVAEPDANYWSGKPGDLIQLGYEDNWRHVVIITRVVKDGNGNTVDYLINSNTADQRNYPVSAYLYPQHRLIRIYGWNDA